MTYGFMGIVITSTAVVDKHYTSLITVVSERGTRG
ncbi:hypothetical protein VRRI112168_15130 [Vreelandella rituensis]